MESIKIAQWGGRHIAYMPLLLAERLGLFAAEGLDVTLYGAGNDNEIYAEVVKGRAAFGVGDPTFAAIGSKQGHQVRVIAAIVSNACNWGLTHHAEIKPIKQISDLVGLRIGTFPKPSTTYTLLAALKARQPRLLKSMQIIETEIGQQAYLLASNRVDMIIELEPIVSDALRQGLRLVCAMGDFFPDTLFTGLMAADSFLREKPEVATRVVRALQKGLDICHTEPEKAVRIGSELFPAISPGIMKEAVQRMIDGQAWPQQALVSQKAWNNALALRVDVGELDSIPDFERIVDQRFAQMASEI